MVRVRTIFRAKPSKTGNSLSGCWRALAKKGTAWAGFYCAILLLLRVMIGWPLPLGFGLDGCLLLARRGRVYV